MSQTLPRRPRLIGPRKTFAIVASMFNEEFVNAMLESVKAELLGVMPSASVPLYRVPGAWEIPVVAEYVMENTHVDVVIALGVVIRGDTAHADIVARSVSDKLQDMAVSHTIPVVNMVLLLDSEEQARARCIDQGELNRGIEAARTALSMAELFQKLHQAYGQQKENQPAR